MCQTGSIEREIVVEELFDEKSLTHAPTPIHRQELGARRTKVFAEGLLFPFPTDDSHTAPF
jgi:hypothetical protein